jgi:hypothetical protein
MYTQPVEVEIGEHQPYVAGGGTSRLFTFHFPNGRQAFAACSMTADGRAELHVRTYDDDVKIFAFGRLCEPPAE